MYCRYSRLSFKTAVTLVKKQKCGPLPTKDFRRLFECKNRALKINPTLKSPSQLTQSSSFFSTSLSSLCVEGRAVVYNSYNVGDSWNRCQGQKKIGLHNIFFFQYCAGCGV